MLLTSILAAYELGYIDQFSLAARLSATFDTLAELERYRGHFLNWIDTRSLQPLNPRYVSTVDSGNLAAALIVTARSLADMHQVRIYRWQRWQGLVDSLSLLDETLQALEKDPNRNSTQELRRLLAGLIARIRSVRQQRERWYALFQEISGPSWQQITGQLSTLVAANEEAINGAVLRQILQLAQQIDNHLKGTARTIAELVPWIPALEAPPALLTQGEFAASLGELRSVLPYSPVFAQIGAHAEQGLNVIERMRTGLSSLSSAEGNVAEALTWLDNLAERLRTTTGHAAVLLAGYNRIVREAWRYVSEMDFQFLYHPLRRVFHIGYNLDAARLDDNFYDLLASEARITSLIAIAKGDIPHEHWLHLNRPVTSLNGMHVLLSWSATMFEYLMPTLFLRSYDGTLLNESSQGAVLAQIEYGRQQSVPWGISESGFFRFDASQNYQYRAFGVPGLGFKRGLGDDLVIAPYASLMAVNFQPKKVLQNAITWPVTACWVCTVSMKPLISPRSGWCSSRIMALSAPIWPITRA
jgi:cyclic beta-1,2-glucan synthetase